MNLSEEIVMDARQFERIIRKFINITTKKLNIISPTQTEKEKLLL